MFGGNKVNDKFSYDHYVSPNPANPTDIGGVYPGHNGENPTEPVNPENSTDKYCV